METGLSSSCHEFGHQASKDHPLLRGFLRSFDYRGTVVDQSDAGPKFGRRFPYVTKELARRPTRPTAAPPTAVVLQPRMSVQMLTMGEQKKIIPMESEPTHAARHGSTSSDCVKHRGNVSENRWRTSIHEDEQSTTEPLSWTDALLPCHHLLWSGIRAETAPEQPGGPEAWSHWWVFFFQPTVRNDEVAPSLHTCHHKRPYLCNKHPYLT